MRIVVDYTICEANAVCEAIAPDIFTVDEADHLHVKAELSDPDMDRLRQAVNACPRMALSLEGE